MRVGLDITKALGPLDGIGRYCRGLLRALADLEQRLAASERPEYRLYAVGEDCASVYRERYSDLPSSFTLCSRESPEEGEVDVYHATANWVPVGFYGPLLFTLYDLTFLTMPELHTLDNRVYCCAGLTRAMARSGRLVAISDATRRQAVAELGVEAEDLAIAAPGLDPRFAPADASSTAAVRSRLDLPEDYVLYVGTLEPRKNLLSLVAAHRGLSPALRQSHPLVIAGGGGWGEVEQTLDGDRGHILLGTVADADLPALFSGAAVFAYPSLYEGFGLPPLEAMACGVPVVASDRGALPEVVGAAAELVDPSSVGSIRSGLARVLEDQARASELRRLGHERARLFTWRSTAETMHELYLRAAEQNRA